MDIYKLGSKEQRKKLNIDIREISPDIVRTWENYLIIMNTSEFKDKKDTFGFPEKAVSETFDSRQLPNAEFYDNLLFMTLNDIGWSDPERKRLLSNEINIFLGTDNVLIVKHAETANFEQALARTDKSDIHKALYSFIDAILENNKRLTSEIEQMALSLEEDILKNLQVDENEEEKKIARPYVDPDDFMEDIVILRKHLQFLKTYYEPTADVIEILEVDASDLIPEQYEKYYMKLSLKADRLSSNLVNLRDYIAQVREAWQAQVDLGFNKVMKIFTVITAIFLPLTLIVGWYGMNFKVFPEIEWAYGYHMVIGLSVAVVLFSLWIFRKNHYI